MMEFPLNQSYLAFNTSHTFFKLIVSYKILRNETQFNQTVPNASAMKKVQVVILLLVFIGLAICQESADCFCTDPWISWREGRRVTGDRLLFREIRSADWHSPTQHVFSFQYQNTNITQWEVAMSPVIFNCTF